MVKHLPSTVKQLLTLRNPQPRIAPPLSRLNAVLNTTYKDAKAKQAEKGWLTLAVSQRVVGCWALSTDVLTSRTSCGPIWT